MIRAHIYENHMGGVTVSVVRHPAEGSFDARPRILHFTGDHLAGRWDEIDDPYGEIPPTFRLGPEEARAVLAGLAAHFHGPDDTRALRRDYDTERARGDVLIGHLGEVARTLAAARLPSPPPPVRELRPRLSAVPGRGA